MDFDDLKEAECVPGNEGGVDVDPTTCGEQPPVPPSSDDRCADPAFRAANPELCAGYPILLLKPEYAITPTGGTIQYRTFLRASDEEYELTNGLAYSSSDIGIAVINAESGLATGVSGGIVTISVTWQNLSAAAQLEVVAVCSEVENNFIILIDNSKSSTVAFSSVYSSRLAFAKEAAKRFVESVNFSKDKVGVAYFNSGGVVTLALSSNQASALAAITAITATASKTNIYAGLQSAMNALNFASGGKVVLMFSDGENNQGADPLLISEPWKAANNILMVVGLRAWGPYFDKLYRIASVGYFLNAYEDTQVEVITTLKGIKNYFCSGDCPETAGTYPVAQLNYRGFANWDVFQGEVDLIGLGVWDVLPGNGLYVDLSGTAIPSQGIVDVLPGGLESKDEFSLVSGVDYRLSIDVAGNNVGIDNTDPVRVTITSTDGLTVFLDETITPSSNVQDFTQSQFEFTASVTKAAKIKIEMVATSESVRNCGPLIDNVVFEDLTNSEVLLTDDFNGENEVEVQPAYSYYGGCLESPPGAQSADPVPPLLLSE